MFNNMGFVISNQTDLNKGSYSVTGLLLPGGGASNHNSQLSSVSTETETTKGLEIASVANAKL